MNNKNRTEETQRRDKVRYLFLRKKGLTGKTYSLSSPMSGKNKAQRSRLMAGFSCLKNAPVRMKTTGSW